MIAHENVMRKAHFYDFKYYNLFNSERLYKIF